MKFNLNEALANKQGFIRTGEIVWNLVKVGDNLLRGSISGSFVYWDCSGNPKELKNSKLYSLEKPLNHYYTNVHRMFDKSLYSGEYLSKRFAEVNKDRKLAYMCTVLVENVKSSDY
jgi:hypothetical protein